MEQLKPVAKELSLYKGVTRFFVTVVLSYSLYSNCDIILVKRNWKLYLLVLNLKYRRQHIPDFFNESC